MRAEYLSERKGRRVEILRPQRGDRVRLLADGARERASRASASAATASASTNASATSCARKLHLRNAPKRIECFDISTFQGGMAVGSMVTFDEGRAGQERLSPLPHQDRRRAGRLRHDVRGAAAPLRRAPSATASTPICWSSTAARGSSTSRSRCCASSASTRSTPSVWPRCGSTRDARAREIERSDERVFLPGRVNPVVLRRNSNALFLLQRAARRGAPLRHHLPPRAARPGAAALGARQRSRASAPSAGAACCAPSAASSACVPRPSRSWRPCRASRRPLAATIRAALDRLAPEPSAPLTAGAGAW